MTPPAWSGPLDLWTTQCIKINFEVILFCFAIFHDLFIPDSILKSTSVDQSKNKDGLKICTYFQLLLLKLQRCCIDTEKNTFKFSYTQKVHEQNNFIESQHNIDLIFSLVFFVSGKFRISQPCLLIFSGIGI